MCVGRDEMGDLGVEVMTGGEEAGAGGDDSGGIRAGGVESKS